MTLATFTIAAVALLCSTAAATSTPVTFESPCECRDNHGEHRRAVKNDPSTPPVDASAIQAVAPSSAEVGSELTIDTAATLRWWMRLCRGPCAFNTLERVIMWWAEVTGAKRFSMTMQIG